MDVDACTEVLSVIKNVPKLKETLWNHKMGHAPNEKSRNDKKKLDVKKKNVKMCM